MQSLKGEGWREKPEPLRRGRVSPDFSRRCGCRDCLRRGHSRDAATAINSGFYVCSNSPAPKGEQRAMSCEHEIGSLAWSKFRAFWRAELAQIISLGRNLRSTGFHLIGFRPALRLPSSGKSGFSAAPSAKRWKPESAFRASLLIRRVIVRKAGLILSLSKGPLFRITL